MSEQEADGLVVPKFASFKAKQQAASASKSGSPDSSRRSRSKRPREEEDPTRSRHQDKRHRSRHDSRDSRPRRDSQTKRHERHHRERRLDAESRKPSSETRSAEASTETGAGQFIIDLKGDALLRKYGGVDRWSTLRLPRHGHGRVLGSEGRLQFEYEGSKKVFSILKPGQGLYKPKYRDGLAARHSVVSKRNLYLRGRKDGEAADDGDGYISFAMTKKGKQSSESGSSDDDETVAYRSIHGKAKLGGDESSASGSDLPDDCIEATKNDPLKHRTMQLNKQIREKPKDVDSWLELVAHQDMLLRSGRENEIFADDELHSYSEIKISLLESALQNCTKAGDRDRVLLALMREGPKVWTSKTTTKRWEELEKGLLPYELWKVRVEFAMCDISTFQQDAVKQMFLRRMHQRFDDHGFAEAIDVMLRGTSFLYDSGFKELSVAIWQAWMELCFFRPDSPTLSSFAEFWESEAPRFGEANAKGWKHFVQQGGDIDAPEPNSANSTNDNLSRDAYKAWGILESKIMLEANLPARTLDEGTEDDPFRVVTYNDIEPFLSLIPSELMGLLSDQLVSSFILFCGYPAVHPFNDYIRDAQADSLLTSVCMPSTVPEPAKDTGVRQPIVIRHLPHYSITPDVLFAGSSWFQAFEHSVRLSRVPGELVLQAVNQLSSIITDPSLRMYNLGITYKLAPSSVKKAARVMLKRYPDESRLYAAYEFAEARQGNTEAADTVLYATMASKLFPGSSAVPLLLASSQLKLEAGELSAAAQLLCSIDEDFQPPSTELPSTNKVLKATSEYQSNLDDLLRRGETAAAMENGQCLALLKYLTASGGSEPRSTSQGNISAAIDTVRDILGLLKGDHVLHGSPLMQFGVKLLYLHASSGPYRRSYIKDTLSAFVTEFPRNTAALSLFEWADMGMRIVDETQTLMQRTSLQPREDCLSNRVFSIEHEMVRGNIHTTRSAYEKALRSDACKHNAGLWASYIRFCAANRQLNAKAVDVLYRALNACPWSKDVAIEAFTTLVNHLKSEDLKSVYNMMTEKGLRVHVDLDEYLERGK